MWHKKKGGIMKIIYVILTVLFIWALLFIGSAYEQHLLCLNGASEYCIEQDFE